MRHIQRRTFLAAVTAAVSGLARPAWLRASPQPVGIKVPAGQDRFGKVRQIGVGIRRRFAGRRLLIAFTPAGKMQESFERDRRAGEYRNDAEVFRAYGMELVGPPIAIK